MRTCSLFAPCNRAFCLETEPASIFQQAPSEDGDALDILILVDSATFPGCVIEARPIGAVAMLDQNVADVKVLAVADASPLFREVEDAADLPSHQLDAVKHFFSVYKQLEGKRTEIKGVLSGDEARELIMLHHHAFLEAHEKEASPAR